jgi:hypothetical protein
MDYGSLYGMGSYFGEDYTAQNLVRLATLTEDNIAQAEHKRKLADLAPEQQAGVKVSMQAELQGVDLTKQVAVIPDGLAGAITTLQGADNGMNCCGMILPRDGPRLTPSTSRSARQTAAFLIYSSLTTRRAPSGHAGVLDAELAVRAARRQYPDHQYLRVDVDQLFVSRSSPSARCCSSTNGI